MIHETWAGAGKGFRFAHSFMQKVLLKQLLDRLRPSVIHTHLPEYLQKLARLNHRALELPLFSNIPVLAAGPPTPHKLVIGFFSQVACSPRIRRFLNDLLGKVLAAGLQAELLLIGGREAEMREFSTFLGHPRLVTRTGFLSPAEISGAIRSCSMGITPVPRHALGKSGSVAAFLSHGIPVGAPHVFANRPGIPGFFSPALQAAILTEPDLDQLESARTALITARDEIRPGTITRKFLHDLNQPYKI